MKSKLAPAIAVAVAALFISLALAACGGGGDPEGVASLTDTTEQTTTGGSEDSDTDGQDRQEAALAFARCMREHGVDFPDPVNGRLEFRSTPGDQADQQEVQEAQQACQHLLEDAAPPVDDEQQAELREATLAFARCMREHGVDYPDPQFQDGGVLQRVPEGAEDDPKFEEARKACQPILDAAEPDAPSGQDETS
jgi:hypothetical protein